jgi:hypothetical protein
LSQLEELDSSTLKSKIIKQLKTKEEDRMEALWLKYDTKEKGEISKNQAEKLFSDDFDAIYQRIAIDEKLERETFNKILKINSPKPAPKPKKSSNKLEKPSVKEEIEAKVDAIETEIGVMEALSSQEVEEDLDETIHENLKTMIPINNEHDLEALPTPDEVKEIHEDEEDKLEHKEEKKDTITSEVQESKQEVSKI